MYYVLKKIGKNEKFFEQINEECAELETRNQVNSKIKHKYEMIKNLLLEDRAKRYTNHTQYCFSNDDENITAIGFFKYGERSVSIPKDEIIRMGEDIISSTDTELPQSFYGEKIKVIRQPINVLKQIAKISKQPLNLINKSFETIKLAISGRNRKNKRIEEREG